MCVDIPSKFEVVVNTPGEGRFIYIGAGQDSRELFGTVDGIVALAFVVARLSLVASWHFIAF